MLSFLYVNLRYKVKSSKNTSHINFYGSPSTASFKRVIPNINQYNLCYGICQGAYNEYVLIIA